MSDPKAPVLRIRWQLQYTRCNLKCPYCIAAWTERPVDFDAERFNRIADKLMEAPYRLVVRLGVEGEIFLSSDILDGVVRLSHHPRTEGVSFSTNLVVPWKRIEPFLDRVDASRLGMGVTLHDTQIDDIDGFFDKVKRVHDRGALVFVGYVALPDRFPQIREYKARLDDMGVPFILNEYNGAMESRPYPAAYTAEDRAFLREHFWSEHYYDMLVERKNPRGRHCLAGYRYIYIGKDGTMLPCGMEKNREWNLLQRILRRFNPKWPERIQERRISRRSPGNILEDGLLLRDGPRICPHSRCDCGNEVQAMEHVGKDYHRTRTLRIIYPKDRADDLAARFPTLRPVPDDSESLPRK